MKGKGKRSIVYLVMLLALMFCLIGIVPTHAAVEDTAIQAVGTVSNGYAQTPGGDVYYIGSGSGFTNVKDITLKFNMSLHSTDYSGWYAITLRDSDSVKNPWDGGRTGYIIMVAGSQIFLYNSNNTTKIFANDDSNDYEYRWAMESILGSSETRLRDFFAMEHSFEASAINEAGGVRISLKIDGTTVFDYLDENFTIDNAGGFSIRTDVGFEATYSKITVNDQAVPFSNLVSNGNTVLSQDNTNGYVFPIRDYVQNMVWTTQEFGNTAFETDLFMINSFGKNDWVVMVMLRDSEPGKLPWEKNVSSVWYKAAIFNNGIQFQRMKGGDVEQDLGSINFGLAAGNEWNYWKTGAKIKITVSDNDQGNVELKVFLNGAQTGATVTDSSNEKITSEGGVTVWTNGYSEKANNNYGIRVHMNNLSITGEQESQIPVELVDLIDRSYMLKFVYNAYKENGTLVLGKHSNCSLFYYNEAQIENQVVELGLKMSNMSGWNLMVFLRDKAPGTYAWERPSGDKMAYYFVIDGQYTLALKTHTTGEDQVVASENLSEKVDWSQFNDFRFEVETMSSGNVMRAYIGSELVLSYTDAEKIITGGGGITVVANTSSGGPDLNITTINKFKANVVDRDPTDDEIPIDPNEEEMVCDGMQNLITDNQIIQSKHNVNFTENKWVLGGAPSADSGDISRIAAAGITNASKQVVDITFKFDSLKVVGSETESDWLGGVYLRDGAPGYSHWDAERADQGAYWVMFTKTNIIIYRFVAVNNGAEIKSLTLPSGFWDDEHQFRLEVANDDEDTYVQIKIFVDGNLTYRVRDREASRIKAGSGFGFMSKVPSTILALQANVQYVEKIPDIDISGCLEVDFTTLVKDTYDWQGQIRSGNAGKTKFYPNAIELLEGPNKNAAYVNDSIMYQDFVLDFKLSIRLAESYEGSEWNVIFTFRDSNPVANTWDKANKNAYMMLILIDKKAPADANSSIILRRVNNTTSAVSPEATLASKGGLALEDLDAESAKTFRIATYNMDDSSVRIVIWLENQVIIDVIDSSENAVLDGGLFMICQNGMSVDTNEIISKSIKFEGMTEGTSRPVWTVGVNEPSPEDDSSLYPQDEYKEEPLEELKGKGCKTTASAWSAIAVVLLAAALYTIRIRRVEK